MERYALSAYWAVALAILSLGAILLPPAAQAQSVMFTQDLDVGSQGAQVTALQNYLGADTALYPEGLVTGYYGQLTRAAVIRFQARHGIAQVGRVGPITRAKLNELAVGGGGTGDVYAPIMSMPTISSSSNAVTISWTTSEPARHRVMYGTTWPFLYATAPSAVDATVDTSASVTLSGLAASTTYFYVRESIDANDNVMWTAAAAFKTN